jgi:hypothetical protein
MLAMLPTAPVTPAIRFERPQLADDPVDRGADDVLCPL